MLWIILTTTQKTLPETSTNQGLKKREGTKCYWIKQQIERFHIHPSIYSGFLDQSFWYCNPVTGHWKVRDGDSVIKQYYTAAGSVWRKSDTEGKCFGIVYLDLRVKDNEWTKNCCKYISNFKAVTTVFHSTLYKSDIAFWKMILSISMSLTM